MVGSSRHHPGENAMSTVWVFLVKFASLIVCTLHCFDRVIFKGHLALSAPCELEYFVDRVLRVRRSHFMKTMAPQYSDRLVAHAQGWRGRLVEFTCIAPASFVRTSGHKTSSATRVSSRDSSVSSAPRKRVPPLRLCLVLTGPHRIDKWWMADAICEKSCLLARPFHINNDGGPRFPFQFGLAIKSRGVLP